MSKLSELLLEAERCIESGVSACHDDPPGDWIDIMENLAKAAKQMHETLLVVAYGKDTPYSAMHRIRAARTTIKEIDKILSDSNV